MISFPIPVPCCISVIAMDIAMDKIVKKCDTSTTSEQPPAPSITQQPRSQATPAIHTDYQQSDYYGGQYQDAHYDQQRGYEHDRYPRNNYDDNYRGRDTYSNPQRWEEQRGDYRDDRRGRDYHRDEPRHYEGQRPPRDVNCDGRDGRYEDERTVRPVETNYKPESSFTSSVGDSMINMPGPVFDAKQMKNMFGRQSLTPQKSNSDDQSHSFSHTPREKSSDEMASRFDRHHSSTPSFGETPFSRNMYAVHASFDNPQFWTCNFCSNDNKITSNTCEACQLKPQESHDKLTTTHRQLQTSYDNLMTTQQQLQKSHDTLKTTHHQLKKSHDSLVTSLQQKNKEISQLQKSFQTLTTSNHQLQNAHDNLAASNHEKEEELLHLQETHQQLVQRFEQTQVELSAKQEEVTILQKKVTETENSWKISHKEISLSKNELGRGGWGVIWIGEFRGQRVAVKHIHELIRSDENLKILNREINTMSQLRHPNLLQFIGAVLDHPSGNPMIITEVMDTSLRKAYESKELTPDPSCRPVILSIMRDVAVGLNYLHCLPDPIIHRDVSSANVLLESKGPRKWKTKISDFGSANFVRAAVTAATGALVYSAPESIVTLYQKKKDQTTKMDSYSYGVLLCEVIMCQFPSDGKIFDGLLQQVKTSSSKLYELIVSCISEEPEKRPTISHVIEQLDC